MEEGKLYNYDEERRALLAQIEKTRQEQEKLHLLIKQVRQQILIFKIKKVLWEILVARINGQLVCPEDLAKRDRELLWLVREPGSLPAALQLAMEIVATYGSGEGGKENG